MKQHGFVVLGVVLAVIMAATATATTFAFDSRFEKLDWTKFSDQAYGYAAAGGPGAVRGAPNTGDGTSVGGTNTAREWLIIGIVAAAALTAGGASFALLRRRQS